MLIEAATSQDSLVELVPDDAVEEEAKYGKVQNITKRWKRSQHGPYDSPQHCMHLSYPNHLFVFVCGMHGYLPGAAWSALRGRRTRRVRIVLRLSMAGIMDT